MSNELTPAIYNATDSMYSDIDAINYSSFKHFLVSPAHYKQYLEEGQEETEAMMLGTAIHHAVLTPTNFQSAYAEVPECDKRTKEGKATWAEFEANNPGKIALKNKHWNICINAAVKMHQNLFFHDIFTEEGSLVEHVGVANMYGLPIKGRIDLYNPYRNICVDLKSLGKPPTLENCRSAVFNNGYHIQACFYSQIIKAIYGKYPTFYFGFIEKKEPFTIGFVQLSQFWMNLGFNVIEREFSRLANCKLLDTWPSFSHSEVPQVISPYEETHQTYQLDQDNE